MRSLLLCVLLAAAGLVQATSVVRLSLDELVQKADHVLVATVVNVDMVDNEGRQVIDPEARTGPGMENTIRLHLVVHEVLQSHGPEVPDLLVVPLWSAWHYSLGDITELAAGTEGIFLLKGDDFVPAYPADFQRGLDERTEVERILQRQRPGESGGA